MEVGRQQGTFESNDVTPCLLIYLHLIDDISLYCAFNFMKVELNNKDSI